MTPRRPAPIKITLILEGQDAADIDAIAKSEGQSRRAVVRSIVCDVLADDRLTHRVKAAVETVSRLADEYAMRDGG